MGLRASAASLLLSIVVAAPCMRKNFCVPPVDGPHMPGPTRQQPQQPASPIKPAASTPKSGHPCTGHPLMHAEAGQAAVTLAG
jgi:hypothetical protein